MCAKKSEAVKNVERAEKLPKKLQIGMFLSNSQLKKLAEFADDAKFTGNKPDGIVIRVGMFPPKGSLGKHTIEIIPYKNNFNASTHFEDLSNADFNKLIKYFEFNGITGYLDIDLGHPETEIPRFPRGHDGSGNTSQNKYKINNQTNYDDEGGGGGPSQTYPRPGSNGNT